MKTNGYLFLYIAFVWLLIVTPAFTQGLRWEKNKSNLENTPSQIDNKPADLLNPHVKSSFLNRNAYKSSSTISEYLPDSIIYYSGTSASFREIFTYDISGNLLNYIKQARDHKNWINSEMNSFIYDNNGNVLSELKQTWVDFFWEKNYLLTYTYDHEGNMLSYLIQERVLNQWINHDYLTFSYDTEGNLLTCLYQLWNIDEWMNSVLCNNYYNENDLLIESKRQVWNNGNWVNSIRNLNTFDNYGRVNISITEAWNGTKWVNTQRLSYSYDNSGNNLTYREEFWGNNEWINFTLITRTYDVSSNKLSEIIQEWANTWVNISKSTLTYDLENNCTGNIICLWNNNTWENNTRAEYSYSEGLVRGMGFVWQESGWVHGDAQLNPQIKEGNRNREFCQWWGSMVDVYYPRLYTGTPDNSLDKNALTVYPNPADQYIIVECNPVGNESSWLYIYDMAGKVVISQYIEKLASLQQVRVNTIHLIPGIYFVELRGGNNATTRKVAISR